MSKELLAAALLETANAEGLLDNGQHFTGQCFGGSPGDSPNGLRVEFRSAVGL